MADLRPTTEQFIRDFFTVLSSGDLVLLKAFFAEDATWTTMITGVPGAGTHRGRDVIIDEFLAPVRNLFHPGDPKVYIDKLSCHDGIAYAETHATGYVKVTGAEYRNLYCWAIEMRDGKVSAVREYMDSAYVLRTLFGQPSPSADSSS